MTFGVNGAQRFQDVSNLIIDFSERFIGLPRSRFLLLVLAVLLFQLLKALFELRALDCKRLQLLLGSRKRIAPFAVNVSS